MNSLVKLEYDNINYFISKYNILIFYIFILLTSLIKVSFKIKFRT